MSETKKLDKMSLPDVKEFMPDKPVTFDPPKMMYVWDDEDANDPESGAPYLDDVFYVNPGLGVKRVYALGDGMGATWDHCAETAGMGAKEIHDYPHDTKDVAKMATDEDEPSIVTYLELQEWAAKGNGQILIRCKDEISYTPIYTNTVTYPEGQDNEIVPWVRTARMGERYIMVRRYGDKEPAHPTREYMRVPATGYSSVDVPYSVAHNLGLNPGQCFHDVPGNTVTKEGCNG